MTMNCKQCGTELPPKKEGRGRPRIFCNPACRLLYVGSVPATSVEIPAELRETKPKTAPKHDSLVIKRDIQMSVPTPAMQYIRQTDGTFKVEGCVKTRYVNLRIFRNGEWGQDTITPLLRTKMIEILDTGEYMPADIYELVAVESTLTDDDRARLAKLKVIKESEEE